MSGSNHNRTKKLYFVRHGLCVLNVAGKFAGHTETPLTPEGRDQAKKAGQEAKKLHIDCIISSPLGRTRETAEIIAKEIGYPLDKILIEDTLIERDCGVLEGKQYIRGYDFSTVATAESDDQLKVRAKKALERINSLDTQSILIVGHGGLGRALRSYIQPEIPFLEQLVNGQIYSWS